MSIEELLSNNESFANSTFTGELPAPPTRRLAVVACMDARVDVYRILGLRDGEAHVIRNAGGIVTDDVIRSLIVSQRKLGTDEIVLIHHTACGMAGLDEEALRAELREKTGSEPRFDFGSFDSVEESVRSSIAKLTEDPYIEARSIRGFVYSISDGRLTEVK